MKVEKKIDGDVKNREKFSLEILREMRQDELISSGENYTTNHS